MEWYFLVLGAFLGSFFNVLIDRLPKGQNVVWGRSHCDFCKKTLRWFELVPVLSFLVQGGRCLRCRKTLSVQYPAIELLTGMGFFFIYLLSDGSPLRLASLLILFSSFLVITVSDMKYQIIPDSMVVAAAIGSILFHQASGGYAWIVPGAFSSLGAGGLLYALWFGTRGRGMGFGDVKLAFVLGAFLGYPQTIMAFYIAFLTGAVLGVILILKGEKSLKSKIAFGPFLILGAVLTYLNQPYLIRLWNTYF